MRILQSLRAWRQQRRIHREASRLVEDLFRDPELLRGTSLKPHHAGRWVHLGHETDDEGRVTAVRFGILRHPRPYAFSRQAHKVIEHYTYFVKQRTLTRERGFNITRDRGLDAE